MRKELSKLIYALTGAILASAGLLAYEISGRGEFTFLHILFLGVGACFLAPVVFRALNVAGRAADRFADRHLVEHPGKKESDRNDEAEHSS